MPRVINPLAALLAAASLAGAASGGPPRPDAADEAACARLGHANAQLRQEVALSAKREFYLRLDVGRGALALVLRGVVLGEHPLKRLERGEPRVAFLRRGVPEGFDVRPLSGGRLEPPRERDRVEVVVPEAPPDAARPGAETPSSPPPIPATAEESYSVPSRYRIEFAQGVTLEIRSPGGARNRGLLQRAADAASLWAQDRLEALRRKGRVRVRVELAAEDAARLYRSLPSPVGLVILDPSGR